MEVLNQKMAKKLCWQGRNFSIRLPATFTIHKNASWLLIYSRYEQNKLQFVRVYT